MPENIQDKKYELITKTDKDSKVEIYLNNRDESYDDDDEDAISFMNVFSNMRKTLKLYAWVMLFLFTVGLLSGYLTRLTKREAESVSAVVTYEYDGAVELKAPNGDELDAGFIKSAFVIQEALKKTPLSKNIGVSSIASNISVSRILSEDTRRQLEIIEKLGGNTSSMNDPQKYVDVVNSVDYNYDTSYIITLSNGFGSGDNDKIYLSGEEMTELLNRIVKEYKETFFNEYDRFNLPENSIEDINIEELDYIEWIENISDIMDMLSNYCTSGVRGEFADYRSTKDGLTFHDISRMVELVRSTRVDYLYSYIYYNSMSKDREKLLTRLEYDKRELEHTLSAINTRIEDGAELIENYKNSNILIDRQQKKDDTEEDDAVSDLRTTSVTDYYNSLILKQSNLEAEKSETEHKLADLNDKLTRFKTGYTSEYKIAKVDEEIKNVNEICRNIYRLTKEHADEIRQSEAYRNSLVTSIDALYQGRFFSKETAMAAGLGGAAGLVVGFIIWFMNALIKELKNERS